MRWTLLLVLAALLLASDALAIDAWVTEPGGAVACTFPRNIYRTFRTCWWDVTEAGSTDVTTQLDTRWCENVSVSWISSITTTNHNSTATIYDNQSTSISGTDLTAEIVQNSVLTGNPATSLYSIYGFDASFVYARFSMVDVGTTGRLKVHCHPTF